MEFLIQISMFSPLVSETFHALFHLKICRSIPLHAKKMSKIRGTLFLVKRQGKKKKSKKKKQGKTKHEHNEKFKRIAA